MRFWRISNFANLNGTGGITRASRWNKIGLPIVYLADHPSTSLLETLVHLDGADLPVSYQLLAIDAPGTVDVGALDLPTGWENELDQTQRLGTKFLTDGVHPLVRIPSAVMPQASNFLLNPNHPDAKEIRIAETWRYPFDSRLLA